MAVDCFRTVCTSKRLVSSVNPAWNIVCFHDCIGQILTIPNLLIPSLLLFQTEYVAELSEELGLKVIHYEELDGFRFEHGVEVRGHMFVLQKKSQEANSEL